MENVNFKLRLNGLTQESCCIRGRGVCLSLCVEPVEECDFESGNIILLNSLWLFWQSV